MHARRSSSSLVETVSRSTSSATELTPAVNGSTHLICLRDLTKNRGDGTASGGELSPPDIKYVPPLAASTTKASPGSSFRRPPSSASRGSASSSPSAAEPAHATSAESPGAVGRQSLLGNGGSTADGPSSPGASGREARSPSTCGTTLAADTGTTTTATEAASIGSGESASATGQGQLNKLKRFLATVQQFADDIAPDIGDRVRTLILALVNSQLCAEEFHRRLQEATNFPLRPFVVPFLKVNLPLLQQELTSTNGHISPPLPSPPPRDSDRRLGRPSTVHPDDSALTPATAGFSNHRHRLWYLGGLVPSVLLPRHHGATGLDLNANGKRTFDRVTDSPIDLKLDLFNAPAIKRLHIDIPARPIQLPPPPHAAGHGGASSDQHATLPPPPTFSSRTDDTATSTVRDLSVDRDHAQRNGPSAVNAAAIGLRRADLSCIDGEDDWQALDSIMQSIVAMVDRCRRTMLALKDQSRRDRVAMQTHHGPNPGPSGSAADCPSFNRSPSSSRPVDDIQVLQIRQLAEEAVNEVKRQAVAELHQAVTAAEVKATVAVTAERARLEKVVSEVRAQARQEAFALLNSQEDSTENCWNCGRKAYETCSGCHRARYCGTFCQHRHWETHHITCKHQSSSAGDAPCSARSSPPAPVPPPRDAVLAKPPPPDHHRETVGRSHRAVSGRAASSSGAAVSETPAIDFSASSTSSGAAPRRHSASPTTTCSETVSRVAAGERRTDTSSTAAAAV